MNFCGALCALLDYFHQKKLPRFQGNLFVMRYFYKITKSSLSNIMKHGEHDVEWQISIQSIRLGAFLNYFLESFNVILLHSLVYIMRL